MLISSFISFSTINPLILDKLIHFLLIQYPKHPLLSFNSNFLGVFVISNNSLCLKENTLLYDSCLSQLKTINSLLKPFFKEDVYSLQKNEFGFNKVNDQLIFNKFEGQVDTGKMMNELLKKAIKNDILVLNNTEVLKFEEHNSFVEIKTNNYTFRTDKLLFANNGFAGNITNNEVKPARAQVLITEPIENLKIKGTFHLDEGYYYFRNINNRILFGGGRNLDFKREGTTKLNTTEKIQNSLKQLLKTVILPKQPHLVAQQWSGIMGLGNTKKPIVEQLSNNVYCGVKMGGMGVAIGSLVGVELADLV